MPRVGTYARRQYDVISSMNIIAHADIIPLIIGYIGTRSERLAVICHGHGGRVDTAMILIWSFRDPNGTAFNCNCGVAASSDTSDDTEDGVAGGRWMITDVPY